VFTARYGLNVFKGLRCYTSWYCTHAFSTKSCLLQPKEPAAADTDTHKCSETPLSLLPLETEAKGQTTAAAAAKGRQGAEQVSRRVLCCSVLNSTLCPNTVLSFRSEPRGKMLNIWEDVCSSFGLKISPIKWGLLWYSSVPRRKYRTSASY
jgi:hypothetical protein